MRGLTGAYLVVLAALLASPAGSTPPVYAIYAGGRLVWETQEWNQRGGDPANLGVYDAAFVNADCKNVSRAFILPRSWRRDFTHWAAGATRPLPIKGEVVSASSSPTMWDITGPQGLLAVATGSGLYTIVHAGYNQYAMNPVSGPYGDTDYSREVMGIWCGVTSGPYYAGIDFVGPPLLLLADPGMQVSASGTISKIAAAMYLLIAVSASHDSYHQFVLQLTAAEGVNAATTPPTSQVLAWTSEISWMQSNPMSLGATVKFPPGFDGASRIYFERDYIPYGNCCAWNCPEGACWGVSRKGCESARHAPALLFGGSDAAGWEFALAQVNECSDPGVPGVPPTDVDYYNPTTAPIVDGYLVVIGASSVNANYEQNFTPVHRIYGVSSWGDELWRFDTNGAVAPNPVILPDRVVFGTETGWVYALGWGGNLLWSRQVPPYLPYPFNDTMLYSSTRLRGPSVDREDGASQYAFFSGLDGRVHRFDLQTGEYKASDLITYYRMRNVWIGGMTTYSPVAITSPPAVCGKKFVAVKAHTQSPSTSENCSLLVIMKFPDMEFTRSFTPFGPTWNLPDVRVDAEAAVFTDGSNEWSGLFLNPDVPNDSWDPTMNFDSLRQVSFWGRFGNGYCLPWYSTGAERWDDGGGVSITQGFVYATDAHGQLIAIPSSQTESLESPTNLGPSPEGQPLPNVPAPLGEIQVYPNPFNPLKAVGGVAKFRNLPEGTTVVLYTLASERVRSLRESGHQAFWDGKNEAGQDAATGVYLYKILQPGKDPVTGRLALVRK